MAWIVSSSICKTKSEEICLKFPAAVFHTFLNSHSNQNLLKYEIFASIGWNYHMGRSTGKFATKLISISSKVFADSMVP